MSMSPDPMMPAPSQPEKSGKTCLILGLIFGGLGAVLLLCGGCCVFGMFQFSGQLGEMAEAELANNPVILEHVGEIQSLEVDWSATINAASERPNTFVFDLAGEKNSGTASLVMLDRGGGRLQVVSGELTLSNGETYQLVEGVEIDAGGVQMIDELPDDGGAEFARQVQVAVSENAILAERIGEIQSFTYDLEASVDEPAEDVYVFRLSGANGNGTLRAECITVDEDSESVTSAELVMENGERVQLFPEKPLK